MSVAERLATVVARAAQGEPGVGPAVLQRELAHASATLGKDHPQVLAATRVLAAIHRRAGALSQARTLLEQAMAAGRYTCGEAHPDMLGLAHDLAQLADELENRHEARRNFDRVLRLGPAVLGPDHAYVRAAARYFGQSGEPAGGPPDPPDSGQTQPLPMVPTAQPTSAAEQPAPGTTAWAAKAGMTSTAAAGTAAGNTATAGTQTGTTAADSTYADNTATAGTQTGTTAADSTYADNTATAGTQTGNTAAGNPQTTGTQAGSTQATGTQADNIATTGTPAATRQTGTTTAGSTYAGNTAAANVPPAGMNATPGGTGAAGPAVAGSAGTAAMSIPAAARPVIGTTHPATVPTSGRPEAAQAAGQSPASGPPVWSAPVYRPVPESPIRPVPAHAHPAGQQPDQSGWLPTGGARLALILVGVVLAISLVAGATLLAVALLQTRPNDQPNSTPTVGASTALSQPPIQLSIRDAGTAMNLSWTDPSNGKVTFVVAYGRADGPADHTQRVAAGVTTITINGLNPRVDYCFTVAGIDSTTTIALSPSVCTSRNTTVSPSPSRR